MFDDKGRFIIKDYTLKSTFASFLPGIAGKYGIPIWCFYVNRGQGVTSFGIEDKEHSIMEFYPAHQAYQVTKTLGFRTFLKIDGVYYEPFWKDSFSKNMYIGMNELEVEEINEQNGIKTNVLYFTLAGEALGGLIRRVTITNMGDTVKKVQLLDGMPAILPYGVNITSVKTMGQTVKAWMQVEDVSIALPYYRVRVGMEDRADVHEITGGHFYFTTGEDGERLPVVVDPEVVFEHDTAMIRAVGLEKGELNGLLSKVQADKNNLPCAFFGKEVSIEPGEKVTIYGIIGQVESKELLKEFSEKCNEIFFKGKYEEAARLTRNLCKVIDTKTAFPVFDAYCRQTYLDNLLRGGYPVVLGKDKIFYLYSRKHGDIERDYNFFRMLPEFYSQGNANFRDVNQNRRCDVLFHPFVRDYNVKTFYNLIQLDGYNPLAVEKTTYYIEEADMKKVLESLEVKKEKVHTLLTSSFTPGNIAKLIYENTIFLKGFKELKEDKKTEILGIIMNFAKENVNADFGEGYWSDHWTYNLDLIETYLMIYPDKEKELLFEDKTYTYFKARAVIKPRKDRYVKTSQGIRQYKAIEKLNNESDSEKLVRAGYGVGEVFTSTLMEKLILMCVLKVTAMDPYGMGIEMEGGKPGWYDALNGLPGIFGSSMCETYELCRMLEFTRETLVKYKKGIELELPIELTELLNKVRNAIPFGVDVRREAEELFFCWDRINEAKEEYRRKTLLGVEGSKKKYSADELIIYMDIFIWYVKEGIKRAFTYGEGISPAYFAYEVTDYAMEEAKVVVKAFKVIPMPHFLEGPVRYLKVADNLQDKKRLYDRVRNSSLYDTGLKMYKVNESLEQASYEVGRAKAFTPGWLENESIWLHMEYKYLLELLKSGLYLEFFTDFKNQCIPFLKEEQYGRSILENSSFIASSANPNEKIHGKGFVARLSGSTAEFIHMWQLMMFGGRPFIQEGEELILKFQPVIPDFLLDETKEIQSTFLGGTKVVYHFNKRGNIIPGRYSIRKIELNKENEEKQIVYGECVRGRDALLVREGFVKEIQLEVELQD